MSEVFENAREQGKLEGKVEIAKRMLKDKLPLELIVRYTELSLESLNALVTVPKK